MNDRVSVRLSKEVIDKLNSLKHPGQSYDGIVRELLEELKGKKDATKR